MIASLSFSLGDVGYVVFVTDGQALKKEIGIDQYYKSLPNLSRREDMLFFHAQCIEMMERHKLGQNIIMSKGFIARVGKTVVHNAKPPNKERFRNICKELGLSWIDTDEAILK
ncbi:MAG: hypothetical protein JRD93_14500 [Deltaproteobacteria bacterium]|nr:hypothetical protein [Deltaproteobacteria bacterium]